MKFFSALIALAAAKPGDKPEWSPCMADCLKWDSSYNVEYCRSKCKEPKIYPDKKPDCVPNLFVKCPPQLMNLNQVPAMTAVTP